ncbi:hypothetical protein GCM10009612_25140 [Streptomyces beijiangensis]
MGQSLVPVIVSAREKILDLDAYNSASSSPIDSIGSAEPVEDKTPVAVAA